jgi:undecaprenyl diphosphate synthase
MTNQKAIPQHVAIIMDGNGRWARRRGLPKLAGHRAGVETAREILEVAKKLGVKVLTLYTFSTENWKRSRQEISALFGLLEDYLDKEIGKLNENDIRFNVIGDLEGLPQALRAKLEHAISTTRQNSSFLLNLALNYGARQEIVEAARAIAEEASAGKMRPSDITEEVFSRHLYTKGIPDPDLLIRTSGEMRISNFLLWQISYTEIYVTKKYWPDFHARDLKRAILDFQRRQRRFGA